MTISACSIEDVQDYLDVSTQTIKSVADGNPDASGMKEYAKEYVDEKTGQTVTATQFRVNSISDALKKYGVMVAIPCFVFGFLLRRILKGSSTIRRVLLFIEIGIPFFWFVITYVTAFIGDSLMG